MLFSFCVAFERYIITKKNYADTYRNLRQRNQRCQPPLSAVKAKSRAVVTRIMQIKRRTALPYPRAKFWSDQVFAAQPIISTTTTSHSQRSPAEQSGLPYCANLRCSPLPAMLLDTASADICMFRHPADISSVVPAARTLSPGTRYHSPELSYYQHCTEIFSSSIPRFVCEITNCAEDKLTSFTLNSFSFLIVPLASSAYQRHFLLPCSI